MSLQAFQEGFALVIGVGNDLPATISDARAIEETLLSPDKAGYLKEHVICLKGPDASKAGILEALEDLQTLVEDSQIENGQATIFIYYSGHGWRRPSDDAYFFQPFDVNDNDFENSLLDASEFMDLVDAIPSKKQIIFLDACHAGSAKLGLANLKPATSKIAHDLDMGSGRILIASSTAEEKSYVGTTYSIFTEVLIEALNGARTQKNSPFVTFADVWQHLSSEVPERIKTLYPGIDQTPVVNTKELTPTRICRHTFEVIPKLPKVFIISSGSEKDDEYLSGMQEMLKFYHQRGVIEQWDATKMLAGSYIKDAMQKNLEESDIVVGLISIDYLINDDEPDQRQRPGYQPDLRKSMVLQRMAIAQNKHFVPLIIRHCPWEAEDDIKNNEPLPKKGSRVNPVSGWEDKDAAYDSAVNRIIELANTINEGG